MMRSSIIFIVLFMLSFSVFHDSFISLIEKNEHTEVVHNICDEASIQSVPNLMKYTVCFTLWLL